MILARKMNSGLRLYRRGGLSAVAELAWDQSRAYLEATPAVLRSARQRAAMLTRVFNEGAQFSFVALDETDARAVRTSTLLLYLRRQFFDVVALGPVAENANPVEIAIHADSLFRRWEFQELDRLLPGWQGRLSGTKFAPRFEQLRRRIALRLGRLSEAADGLALAGGDVADCLLRAEVFDAQDRTEDASRAFEQAVHRQTYEPQVRLSYAFHLLKRGELWAGLENWGLADRLLGSYPLRRRHRQWAGEKLENRTLLVIFEHGLGDMIQLSRFLLPLREAHPDAHILGRVPGPLVGLLARSFPDVSFVADEDDEPRFDFYVPSLQLPLVIEARSLEPSTGYLRLSASPSGSADPAERAARARVGICWRGHPRQYELSRSVSIETFAELFRGQDVDFVVLLNRLTPEEDTFLATFGNVQRPSIRDFNDLGALVDGCDLVVSVDTAVAHVAGAGGKRALLLSRPDSCWRWGCAGSRSAWYPTIEVLRHPGDMDWTIVLGKARKRMQEVLSSAPAALDA